MKTKAKFSGKHIKFDKYDTVQIVALGDKKAHQGLLISHSEVDEIKGYPYNAKLVIGSQRGAKTMLSIWNVCGIKIMPSRIVLIEKMKGERSGKEMKEKFLPVERLRRFNINIS